MLARQDLQNLLVGRDRSARPRAEHRKTGNRIFDHLGRRGRGLRGVKTTRSPSAPASSESPAPTPSLPRSCPGRSIRPLVGTLVCMVSRSYHAMPWLRLVARNCRASLPERRASHVAPRRPAAAPAPGTGRGAAFAAATSAASASFILGPPLATVNSVTRRRFGLLMEPHPEALQDERLELNPGLRRRRGPRLLAVRL